MINKQEELPTKDKTESETNKLASNLSMIGGGDIKPEQSSSPAPPGIPVKGKKRRIPIINKKSSKDWKMIWQKA